MYMQMMRKYCKFGNFREGFIIAKIKSSRNAENTMSLIDICKSCASREFLASQICLLINVIRENKILAKISGFTALQFTFTAPVRKSRESQQGYHECSSWTLIHGQPEKKKTDNQMNYYVYSKLFLSGHSKRRPKIVFKTDYLLMQVKVLQNAPL